MGKNSPLDPETKSKIAKAVYFHEGPDRASNAFKKCDLLIVLGTPRTGGGATQQDLIGQGKIDAANRNVQWGDVKWEAIKNGKVVDVEGRGYNDPDWQESHRRTVLSPLIQAAGRARSLCENGIPLVLISNEPGLGLPVQDLPVLITDAVVGAVGHAADQPGISTKDVASKIGKANNLASRLLLTAGCRQTNVFHPAMLAEGDRERA